MTIEEQDRIEAACIRLQMRYGTLADRQDAAFRDLFVPDASIELPGYPPFAGVDAIMAGQAEWRASTVLMRHVCTNFTIDVIDQTHAKGLCYLSVFVGDATKLSAGPQQPSQFSLGEFHDTFVKRNG